MIKYAFSQYLFMSKYTILICRCQEQSDILNEITCKNQPTAGNMNSGVADGAGEDCKSSGICRASSTHCTEEKRSRVRDVDKGASLLSQPPIRAHIRAARIRLWERAK